MCQGLCGCRSLGHAYRFVRGQRQCQKGPEELVGTFKSLVDILRLACGPLNSDLQRLQSAVCAAREMAAKQRAGMAECQSEIHRYVATQVEALGGAEIECLSELPEEVSMVIANRETRRASHVRQLRSTRDDVLQAGVECCHKLMQGPETTTTMSELEHVVIARLEAREEHLKRALEEACAGAEACSIEQGKQRRCVVGALVEATMRSDCEGNQVASTLQSYAAWVEAFVDHAHAGISDAAMAMLRKTFADDGAVDVVLGLCDDVAGEDSSRKTGTEEDNELKKAMTSAAAAIKQEREHQLQDGVGLFPSTALLRAGRHVLAAWQVEAAAVKELVQVHRMLEQELADNEQCLQSGEKSKEKDVVIGELRTARQEHERQLMNLRTLQPVMSCPDSNVIASVAKALGYAQVPTLESLRRDARESLDKVQNATFRLSQQIQPDFPEVILFIGQGLPSDLGRLWCPTRALQSFDESILEARESAHAVYRVRSGNEQFAIKEYKIKGALDLRTCLKEAAIVHRLRHPAIVEIRALFQADSNMYVQMPWYENGSLDKWVAGKLRPEWHQVRQVLLDALLGLAHLHDNAVIHSDVKPSNVLVDGRERGRLADFDISIDTATRTSARAIRCTAVKATALGWTEDYAAPELEQSKQATTKTDMFAYGKTVQWAQRQGVCDPACNTADFDRASGQADVLVATLTSEAPSERPSANEAVRASFFIVLNDVCKRVGKTCVLCDLQGDDAVKESSGGIECSEAHFHCGACVAQLAHDLLKEENGGKRQRLGARVMCCHFPVQCGAAAFDDRDLARVLPAESFHAVLQARIECMEAELRLQLEEQKKREVEEELERLRVLSKHEFEVLRHRKHIEEEILQMKCPRCRRAFYDFEGCFAISCSTCACKFCGWCLQDCGEKDAHPHVRTCGKVPRGVDALFPQMPDVRGAFDQTHQRRCRERIDEYLESLPDDIRKEVREVARKLLADVRG